MGASRFWTSVIGLATLCQTLHAFVFYPVGTGVLRWNVESGLAHPNVVNPVTKAVRYYIATNAWSSANREKEINAVRACFDQWQSISGSNLRFEFAGFAPAGIDVKMDNTNVVFWAKQSLFVDGGEKNLSYQRGWTSVRFANDGTILEADIVLNGIQYDWFTDFNHGANQAQFIESVLLHEIGHFVGLDHTPAGAATVVNGGNGVGAEAGLSADEIAAMRFLYGSGSGTIGGINGTIRMNGAGILGAIVIAEDSAGNIAGATVTRASGEYNLPSLPPGTYQVRVCPFDPASWGNDALMRGAEIALEYAAAQTAFLPSDNAAIAVAPGQNATRDFDVTAGNPPFRIASVSRPFHIENVISALRYGVAIPQGQSNLFVAVSSRGFQKGAVLSVTGDGITLGPTTYREDRIAPGIHSLEARITVSSNATPGLRSFVVTQKGKVAYANGFLEIAPAAPDYNFDALDDRFQRRYWPLWTAPETAPDADPDGDAFSNSFEFRTGTSPVDPRSNQLKLNEARLEGPRVRLLWDADAGRSYQLLARPTLAGPGSGDWAPVGNPIEAAGETLTTSFLRSQPAQFYRLELLP